MKKKFTDADPTKCTYVRKCKRGHIGPNGYNIKFGANDKGSCLACIRGLPDGPFTETIEGITKYHQYPNKEYATREEAKAAHIQRVMQWNKDNPEKFKKYVKKYHAKEEVKARCTGRVRDVYRAMTPEERKEHNKASYARLKQRLKDDPEFAEKHFAKQRAYDTKKRMDKKLAEVFNEDANFDTTGFDEIDNDYN